MSIIEIKTQFSGRAKDIFQLQFLSPVRLCPSLGSGIPVTGRVGSELHAVYCDPHRALYLGRYISLDRLSRVHRR